MNVQPVAIVGKGGRILKPGDVKENYLKQVLSILSLNGVFKRHFQ